jgi:hypothetical protein
MLIQYKNPLAYFTNFADLKLFKSKQIRNSKLSNRKGIEKKKNLKNKKRPRGTVSAQRPKWPTAHLGTCPEPVS